MKAGIIGLMLAGVLTSSAAFAEEATTCVRMTESEVAAMFDRWNDSLKTGNAKTVSENYLSDAVLLPTLSDKVRLTNEERIEYFEKFLAKKPVGHIDSRTIRLGCNKAIDTGTYTFTFGDGSKAAARYTFTYSWNGEKWLISTHHSSAMPE
ncbi:SgcJ/EcaC family oxidoreductase [Erwinia psidii]|uniref:SgcJ/EcaC family oxidoreductase n=1 Tax=Erwinia psidii TaxID=69224 RepID=UPI00226B057C|nr:SgcJ/EcaC family oxidoreductase [Erwinia psidii]MCX8958692.1 SgcJ/EcaC family oxidoreductase [Erwinia psidii]MCX8961179.1 SgcJ/EcaC family oxidoreductase [Erwinia psidii]MCX8966649.1 SgcJ/EcaC family oxidoreductase [Erwinia psidii]